MPKQKIHNVVRKEEEIVAAGFIGSGESRERFVFEVTIVVSRNAVTCSEQSLVNQAHDRLDDLLRTQFGASAVWLKVKLLQYAEKVKLLQYPEKVSANEPPC